MENVEGVGNVRTWTAIDADTKLTIDFLIWAGVMLKKYHKTVLCPAVIQSLFPQLNSLYKPT